MMKRLIFLSVSAALAGCSMVSKIPGVKKIPGMGGGEDPVVVTPANGLGYSSDRALQVGDVVGVAVYQGLRSSSKYFDNEVTVREDGTVAIGDYGNPRVLGMKVSGAMNAIGSEFRRSARTSGARLTVHIASVNGTNLVQVEGKVGRPGIVLWSPGMSAKEALTAAGGKSSGAGSDFVYVSSRGVRKTLVLDGMRGDVEEKTKLRAGDIVEVPGRL